MFCINCSLILVKIKKCNIQVMCKNYLKTNNHFNHSENIINYIKISQIDGQMFKN